METHDFKRIWLRFLFSAALLVNILTFCGFAEGDMLKIGLFYGGSARGEYTVSADRALEAGGEADGMFKKYFLTDSSKITVKKDSSWHVQYASVSSAEEAKAKSDELSNLGLDACPVYSGGTFKVWGGSFASENDALWAAENLAAKGTAVSPTGSMLCAYDSDSGKLCFIGDKIALGSSDKRVIFTAVASKEYRGAMLFIPAENGITAINIIDREEYLYSVISREMSPSWHIEALKAQAVCARNYAENNRGKHSAYGFDLCDTVCCQAYGGTSAETENSYPPVDQTRGELLMYEGKPALTFYSSSMGPSTEDVKYVWGSNYPYLTSVENPYEDYENVYNGKWENTLTKERATEIMKSKGYNVGEVTEIKALEYSPSGRVIKLLVKGSAGEKIFERESCRTAFSEATLSQLYTVSGGGEETYPVVSVLSSGGKTAAEAKDMAVISREGKSSVGKSFCVRGSGDSKSYAAVKSGDSFVFSGMGWGHGVGMSQYGAKGMAEAGFDYKAILTHYFKGTEVVKN